MSSLFSFFRGATPLGRWSTIVGSILVTFAFQLLFFDRWMNFMDEGHMLQFADMIASGKHLYRDATVYPLPGAFYFLSAAFRLFEPSILLSRWIVMIQYSLFVGAAVALMFRIGARRYVGLGLAAFLVYRIWVFPHWHMYSYSTSALLVQMGCLLCLLRYFECGRLAWLSVAGLVFGVGVAVKQDYGAASMLAFVSSLVVYARAVATAPPLRSLLVRFFAPAAGVGAVVGAYFLYHGILPDLLRFTVMNHLVGMAAYEYRGYPPFLPLGRDPALRSAAGFWAYIPAVVLTVDNPAFMASYLYRSTGIVDVAMKLFYYAPIALIPSGAFALWLRRGRLAQAENVGVALAQVALFAFSAWLLVLSRLVKPQDYTHLIVLYGPGLCFLPLIWGALRQRYPRIARGTFAVLLVPLLLFVGYSGQLVWKMRSQYTAPLPMERGGVYVTPGQARSIGELVAYLHEHTEPDEVVAVFPYSPLVSFLADRDGPNRTGYIVWPFPELPGRDGLIVDSMEEDGTEFVVLDFVDILDFDRFPDFAPELFAYLTEHYELDRVFSDPEPLLRKLAVFRRTREAPAGEPLRPFDHPGTSLQVEPDDAPSQPIPPHRWKEYLATDPWPLRPVLALRPSGPDASTVLSVPIDVRRRTLLRSSIGVHPTLWGWFALYSVDFTLAVRDGDERQIVFERTLDPTNDLTDRGWLDFEVDLTPWAGRSVRLEFMTRTPFVPPESKLLAAWGDPRLVDLN